MLELSEAQLAILERLRARGFAFVAFPLYASKIGVRKGNCAALLDPIDGDGLGVFGAPSYLVGSNLSVTVSDGTGKAFVWKKTRLEATPERLEELARFSDELTELLAELA